MMADRDRGPRGPGWRVARLADLRLDDLLDAISPSVVHRFRPGVEIADVAYDSRRVRPGALFVCVPGAVADGHDHAAAAVRDGAVALVVERPLELDVPQAEVPDARGAMAALADRFFGEPTRELRVIGITGTNGKTTTAFLLHAILEAGGEQAGLLGTVEQRVGGVAEPCSAPRPRPSTCSGLFPRMLRPATAARDRGLPRTRSPSAASRACASPRRRSPT